MGKYFVGPQAQAASERQSYKACKYQEAREPPRQELPMLHCDLS
jgi:hypothetical protein